MPSRDNQSPAPSGVDWPAIVKTLLVQVLALLALSGAVMGYLRWSSDANWADFTAASRRPEPDAGLNRQSSSPVQTAKRQATCDRKS